MNKNLDELLARIKIEEQIYAYAISLDQNIGAENYHSIK